MDRGDIEWTNGWRDDANNPAKRRWLLIGDSVARGWRGRLQEMVQFKDISVDFFATSLHIEDPAFFKELRHFLSFDEYRYEMVLVNWGGHHGFSRSCLADAKTYFSYKTHYENLLNLVRDTAFASKMGGGTIIVNSTPEVLSSDLNVFDEPKNKEIATRNQIALELAKQYKLCYVDHFGLVIQNKPAFIYRDHVHFIDRAEYIILSKVLLQILIQSKIITETGDIVK